MGTQIFSVEDIEFFAADGDVEALRFNNKMNGAEDIARSYAKFPDQVENGRKFYDQQQGLIAAWDGIYARGIAAADKDLATKQANYESIVAQQAATDVYRASETAKIAALQAEIDGADTSAQQKRKATYDRAVADQTWLAENKAEMLGYGISEAEYNSIVAQTDAQVARFANWESAKAAPNYKKSRQREIEKIERNLLKAQNQPVSDETVQGYLDDLNDARAEYVDIMDGSDDIDGANPDEEMKGFFARLIIAWQVSLPGLFTEQTK